MAEISPLNRDLVRIRHPGVPKEEFGLEVAATNQPQNSVALTQGMVSVNLASDMTAQTLIAQLSQLGVTSLSVDELIEIAAKNNNSIFDESELAGLDAYLEGKLADDAVLARQLLSQNGLVFKYLSPRLQADRNLALMAVKQNWQVIIAAPENYKNDREFCEAAVAQSGDALYFVSDALKDDEAFVLSVVSSYGNALAYVSERLKNNKTIVTAAVQNDGLALKNASRRLRNDKEILMRALVNNVGAFSFASLRLRNDQSIALAVVSQDGSLLSSVSRRLQNKKAVVLRAVLSDGAALKFASKKLANNWDIVLAAVSNDGTALRYASHSLKYNPLMCELALRQIFGNEYNQVAAKLEQFNLDFPQRFLDKETILEIINNRDQIDGSDVRPTAVFIYPKVDHNGAFENNKINELIGKGYRVLYFEAGSEAEWYQALAAAQITSSDGLFVLGAHSNQREMHYGDGAPSRKGHNHEEFEIDLTDEDDLKKYAAYFGKTPVIIIEGCSAGKGGRGQDNLANMFKRIVPSATVVAPMHPVSLNGINYKYEYDQDNKVTGAYYYFDEEYIVE